MALELPARTRERIVEWRSRAIGGRDDLRLVAEVSLHVTLAFIGRRPESEIEAVAAAMKGAVSGLAAPRLQATGVRPVPPRMPRLFALDLEDVGGRAAELQSAVAEALSAGGFYTPERRPFWPHVTFARVRRGAERARPVELPPPSQPFTAPAVTLYRSHLSPRGARYEPLERVALRRR